jgi:hypothetical protein
MTLEERPQLPLTRRRIVLVVIGGAMFVAQIVFAWSIAPMVTGPTDANPGLVVTLWGVTTLWCVVVTLLLVRQADMPDIATAAMLVTIATFATFTLSAANDLRGTDDAWDLVDALFLNCDARGARAASSDDSRFAGSSVTNQARVLRCGIDWSFR